MHTTGGLNLSALSDAVSTGTGPDSVATNPSSRHRWWLWAHLFTLVAGLAILLHLTRRLWFWLDEWDFIALRGLHHPQWSLWRSHNGHWSTLPILAYRLLLTIFGLRSYTPYITLLIVLHLALAHVLWRVMLRSGVSELAATGLAGVFVVLGAGSADIVWAFQIGFVASLVLGWICVLVACDAKWSYLRAAGCWVLAIASLMCSGVGTTMLALVAFTTWAQQGLRRAVVIASVPALCFLAWYVPVGRASTPRFQWRTMPPFVATGLTHAFGAFVGDHATVVGAIVIAGIVLLLALRVGAEPRRTALASIGLIGALAFFVLAGLGRSFLGTTEAKSGRYAYVALALALPAVALALDTVLHGVATLWRSVRRGSGSRSVSIAVAVVAAVAVVPLAITNAVQLRDDTHGQVRGTTHLHNQLDAAATLLRSGESTFPNARPDAKFAPYLSAAQLKRMVDAGWLPTPRHVDATLAMRLRAVLQVAVNPRDGPAVPPGPRVAYLRNAHTVLSGGCAQVLPSAGRPVVEFPAGPPFGFSLRPDASGRLSVALSSPHAPGVAGPTAHLVGGRTYRVVVLATDVDVRFQLPTGGARVCGLQFAQPPPA